ncbi:MAG: hypothetical protein WDN31_07835 [Hyphomicrobium sp.]
MLMKSAARTSLNVGLALAALLTLSFGALAEETEPVHPSADFSCATWRRRCSRQSRARRRTIPTTT